MMTRTIFLTHIFALHSVIGRLRLAIQKNAWPLAMALASICTAQAQPNKLSQARLDWQEAHRLLEAADFVGCEKQLAKSRVVFAQLQAQNGLDSCDLLLADLAYEQGEWQEAEQFYRLLLDRRKTKADRLSAQLYNNIAACLYRNGRYAQATDWHRKALQFRQALFPEGHPDVADSHSNLANCFFGEGQLEKAVDGHQKALEMRRHLLSDNHPDVAISLVNTGNCLFRLKKYAQSLDLHRQALAIRQTHFGPKHPLTASALQALSKDLAALGRLTQAIDIALEVRDIQEELLGKSHHRTARTYELLGDLYSQKGEDAIANSYHRQSLAVQTQLFGAHPSLAALVDKLALSYQALADVPNARQYHQLAIQWLNSTTQPDPVILAGAYNNLGNTYLKQREFQAAKQYYQQALTTCQLVTSTTVAVQAIAANNLGLCEYSLGKPSAAIPLFQQAIELDSSHLMYHKNLALALWDFQKEDQAKEQLTTSLRLARQKQAMRGQKRELWLIELLCLSAKWMPASAEAAYEEGLQLADSLRMRWMGQGEVRTAWRGVLYDLYRDATAHYARLAATGQESAAAKAFLISEKNRSFDLLGAVIEADAKSFAGIPDSLLAREESLYGQIRSLEDRLLHASGDERERLDADLFALYRTRSQFIEQLESRYPAYHQLKYAPASLQFSDLQQRLREENKQLLAYYQLDSSLLAFLLDGQRILVRSLDGTDDLQSSVESLLRNLRHYPQAKAEEMQAVHQQFARQSHGLYTQLMAKMVDEMDPDKSLTILPDGALYFLPFELLLTEPPDRPSRYKQHAYLLRQFPISYQHSAALYLAERKARTNRLKGAPLLAFAPDFSENSYGLANLQYNVAEAKAVADLYGGLLVTGKAATRTQFLQKAPLHNILLLATHAEANARSGEYSWMAFSELSDTIEDGLLFAKDLYGLHLPSELVVLSACETGIGEYQRGEGVMSLSRGFFYAGAQSLVNTLWSVDDAKNSDLIQLFFQELRDGVSKDVALQQAKLKYLDQHTQDESHPLYWAAPVLLGKTDPLTVTRTAGHWYLALALVIALLVGGWLAKRYQ
ncbi:MAG: tetratricopeptide repeat protein [Bacteroidota bacterium]